jgi:type VI secretion system protein ImpG
MDPRMLEYYNRELGHLREMGGEFAREFPKVAGRLGLEQFECTDPYVERLLEGAAFLAARVQLKIDAEFPRFTQHLLEMVYPHYLAPVPSMAVVQFEPDKTEGSLAGGVTVPRGSALRSRTGPDDATACEYRTAHDVTLWPLELTEAEYFTRDTAAADVPDVRGTRAGLRLRLRCGAGLKFSELSLERLPLFLRGGESGVRLYEQLRAGVLAVAVRPPAAAAGLKPAWQQVLGPQHVVPLGFDDEQALLPYGPRSFQGYRLLQEYFAFPQRFLFVEVGGLGPAVRRCDGDELELLILFDRTSRPLEYAVERDDFAMFCAPAVNLFPRRADRIHLSDREHEHHVVPDRTRPLDFEVHEVRRVLGYGSGPQDEQEFLPFYQANDLTRHREHGAYYTVHRLPRVASEAVKKHGPRSSYVGSEVFLSLVDAREAPYRHDLRQLAVETWCTNRDLPLHMPLGLRGGDFTLEAGAPVEVVRCVAGPTRPLPSPVTRREETAWRLIGHLSLNYLSLADTDDRQGAAALRELLGLYAETSEPAVRKQVDGVRSVRSEAVTRRMPLPGPIAFGRGQRVTLTFEETAFEGSGVYPLGAVLEQFLARYASINSFTETVLTTTERGEVARWPARAGRRQTL